MASCYKINALFIYLILIVILSGCTTTNNTPVIPPMALNDNSVETSMNNQIVLMTFKIKNNAQLKFKPTIQTINLRNSSTFVINQYAVAAPCRVDHGYKVYLLSFSLPKGNYELLNIAGYSDYQKNQSGIVIPLHRRFVVGEDGIVYLGSINASLQSQTDITTLWAGSMAPVLDQSAKGFAGGNYIINISDDYAEDMTDYSNAYPELIEQNITKSILSDQQQQLLEK